MYFCDQLWTFACSYVVIFIVHSCPRSCLYLSPMSWLLDFLWLIKDWFVNRFTSITLLIIIDTISLHEPIYWQYLLYMEWLTYGMLYLHLSASLWCFCPLPLFFVKIKQIGHVTMDRPYIKCIRFDNFRIISRSGPCLPTNSPRGECRSCETAVYFPFQG